MYAQGQGSNPQQVDPAVQAAQLQQAAAQQQHHQQQQQHQFALMMQHHQQQQQQMFLAQCNEVASASGMPHAAFPAWRMHGANPSSPQASQFPFNPFTGAGANGARSVQSFPNQHTVQQFAAAAQQQQQHQAAQQAAAAAACATKAGQQQQQRKQNSLHVMSAPTYMDPNGRLPPRGAGDNNGATSRAPPGAPGAQEEQQKGRLAHNQQQQAMPGPLQAAGPRGGGSQPALPQVKEEGPRGARNADGTPALANAGSNAPEPTVKERRAQVRGPDLDVCVCRNSGGLPYGMIVFSPLCVLLLVQACGVGELKRVPKAAVSIAGAAQVQAEAQDAVLHEEDPVREPQAARAGAPAGEGPVRAHRA